jgi:hypothetical protein
VETQVQAFLILLVVTRLCPLTLPLLLRLVTQARALAVQLRPQPTQPALTLAWPLKALQLTRPALVQMHQPTQAHQPTRLVQTRAKLLAHLEPQRQARKTPGRPAKRSPLIVAGFFLICYNWV